MGSRKKDQSADKKKNITRKVLGGILLAVAGFAYCFSGAVTQKSDTSKKLQVEQKQSDEADTDVPYDVDAGKADDADTNAGYDVNIEAGAAEVQEIITGKAKQPALKTETDHGTDGKESGKININTASYSQLCSLKGIGPSKAEKIMNYRDSAGAFTCIEDIMKVPGIKEGIFNKIREQITV